MLGSLTCIISRRISPSSFGLYQSTYLSAGIKRQRSWLPRFYTASSPPLKPSHSSTSCQTETDPTKIQPFIHDYTGTQFISTLDRSRLTRSDYHRISTALYTTISPRMLWPSDPSSELLRKWGDELNAKSRPIPYDHPYVSFVTYKDDRKGEPIPFPRGTRGFFYYDQTHPDLPLSGHLRFRITPDSNPANWNSGSDLLLPDGTIWKRNLLEIIGAHPQLTALRTLLLADGMISPELVNRCKKIVEWRKTLGPNVLLWEPGQVFWTAFSAFDRGQFAVVGREVEKYVRIMSFFRDFRHGYKPLDPYSGSALCKFELVNPSSSRTGRRKMRMAVGQPLPHKLVLRVIKIMDPVTCTVPDYDGYVQEPKAGELMSIGVGDARRAWMYNLGTGSVIPALKTGRVTAEQLKEEALGLDLLLDQQVAA